MFSDKLPSPLSAPLPRFLPVLVSGFLYCTMHPSGSRLFMIFMTPARRSRGTELSDISKAYSCSFEPVTPIRLCGPRKSSVPGRVQKEATFMVVYQHRMAHGVVSKDRSLGSISGMERFSNQRLWLFQQLIRFPVPAQSDYRNILSSSNST